MIQLNLLPDVKMEYIKARRQQHLVVVISGIVAIAAIVILVLTLLVNFAQKQHLNGLRNTITSESNELKNKPQIDKILTVQNQLASLTQLHDSKPAVANLFTDLNEVTPASVAITNLNVDFNKDTITLTGTADSLASVNTYIDTLKLTTYTDSTNNSNSGTATPAFSDVVLSSFGLNSGTSSAQAASYTINLSYAKSIFDITKTVSLTVPSEAVTRASQPQPTDLFQSAPSTTGGTH